MPRWALPPVAAFAAMGTFWGAFAALLPDIKVAVRAGDLELGLALLTVGVGALPAMLTVGESWRRVGWAVLPVSLVTFAAASVLPGLVASPLALALVLLAVGAASGALDVSMNAAVSDVEAATGRRLMFAAHALFSLAVLVSSIATGLLREARVTPLPVLVGVATVLALVGVLTWPVRGRGGRAAATSVASGMRALSRRTAGRSVLILAILCGATFLIEDALQNWSALHVERTLGGSPALGGAGPGMFAGSMFLGRALGQLIGGSLSERTLVAGGGTFAALGLALAAIAPLPIVALVGFAMAGAAVSLIAPALFARAGRMAGPEGRGAAIAALSTIGYLGFVVGPAAMGLVAAGAGLRTAFAALALLAVALAVAARAALGGAQAERAIAAGEELMRVGRG